MSKPLALEGKPISIPLLGLFNRETQTAIRKLKLRRLENGDIQANTPDGRRTVQMTHAFNMHVATYRRGETLLTFPIPGFPESEMPQAA